MPRSWMAAAIAIFSRPSASGGRRAAQRFATRYAWFRYAGRSAPSCGAWARKTSSMTGISFHTTALARFRWRQLLASRASLEPLDELERLLGDLPPAGVDRQRVPAALHLHDLGHALVALLLLVGRVRDRPGDRLIRVGRDDQHRTALRVRRVDLRLGPRIEVRG